MEIVKDFIKQGSIQEFAVANNLRMLVKERRLPADDACRFYACFEDCDIKGDGVLIGEFGNGSTPEQAIEAYAKKISLRTLVIHGNTDRERTLSVWRLV
jgi:hypothetical protein